MNLTRYNPNLDRGITTQDNLSGLRCFDGEDLRKKEFPLVNKCIDSEGPESQTSTTAAERVDLTANQREGGCQVTTPIRQDVRD